MQVASTASYISRAHKLAPLCGLIFHSSVQHPLLAGALAQLAEDQGNCAYIASVGCMRNDYACVGCGSLARIQPRVGMLTKAFGVCSWRVQYRRSC